MTKFEKKQAQINPLTSEKFDLNVEIFQKRLADWFEKNRRDLPWRRFRTPYTVWVSEIMLQQTQVRSVAEYFTRFVAKFPNIESLAQAPLQDVLKVWEGLGYYSRARNLHRAAKMVLERFGGQLPDSKEAILQLPGIGPYTAGAILSLAFGVPEPVLDGNVIRVLSRVFLFEEPVDSSKGKATLWQLAEELLPSEAPGRHNEALMELGATVCTPREPECAVCPVRDFCGAFSTERQAELPVRNPRKKTPHYHVAAGVIWKDGEILITLRPTDKMLGGLWEFPGGKCLSGETLETCLQREIREELNLTVRVGRHFMDVKHAYSHFKITLHMFHCEFLGGRPKLNGVDDFRWVQPKQLRELPFPAADVRVIRKILNDNSPE